MIELYEGKNHFYIIMEYLEGGSLKKHINNDQLTISEIALILLVNNFFNAIHYLETS